MTNPYNPFHLARERMEGDEQTFAKAKEAMAMAQAEIRDEAETLAGAAPDETEDERRGRLDVEASDRLQAVQDELAIEREESEGGP